MCYKDINTTKLSSAIKHINATQFSIRPSNSKKGP